MSIAPDTCYTPAYRLNEEEAQERFGAAAPNPKRMSHAAELGEPALRIAEIDYSTAK